MAGLPVNISSIVANDSNHIMVTSRANIESSKQIKSKRPSFTIEVTQPKSIFEDDVLPDGLKRTRKT